MSMVDRFRNFLVSKDLYANEGSFDNGEVYFTWEQTMENGGRVLLVANFSPDENFVDLKVLGIAKITNPLKRENFLSLINELNSDYRFTKFYEANGEISATYSMYINDDHTPEEIIDTLIMIYRSCTDNYPKFMRLVWS